LLKANKKIEINTTLYTNDLIDTKICDDLQKNIDYISLDNKLFQSFIKNIHDNVKEVVSETIKISNVSTHRINRFNEFKKQYKTSRKSYCGLLFLNDSKYDGVYFNDYNKAIPEKKGRYILFSSILNCVFLENYSDKPSNIVFWLIDY